MVLPKICLHCFMAEFDPRDELLYCHHPMPPWAKSQIVRGSNQVAEDYTCPVWHGGPNARGMQHAGHTSSNPDIKAKAEAYDAKMKLDALDKEDAAD